MVNAEIAGKNYFIINPTSDYEGNFMALKKFYNELCAFLDKQNMVVDNYSIMLLPSIYMKPKNEAPIGLTKHNITFVGINGVPIIESQQGELFESERDEVLLESLHIKSYERLVRSKEGCTILLKDSICEIHGTMGNNISLKMNSSKLKLDKNTGDAGLNFLVLEKKSLVIITKGDKFSITDSEIIADDSEIRIGESNGIQIGRILRASNCKFSFLDSKNVSVVIGNGGKFDNNKITSLKSSYDIGMEKDGSVIAEGNTIESSADEVHFFDKWNLKDSSINDNRFYGRNSQFSIFWDVYNSRFNNNIIDGKESSIVAMLNGKIENSVFKNLTVISDNTSIINGNILESVFDNILLIGIEFNPIALTGGSAKDCSFKNLDMKSSIGAELKDCTISHSKIGDKNSEVLFGKIPRGLSIFSSELRAKTFSKDPEEEVKIRMTYSTVSFTLPSNYSNQ